MPKPRPTAADRELADFVRGLKPGRYSIDVELLNQQPFGFGLARLKPEGGAVISLDDKTIYLTPEGKADAKANRGTAGPDQPGN